MNLKKTKQKLKQEMGFSLVEMLVAMALLSLIMMISINIMTIVGKTAQTVDYQVNVTQESSYAAERMKRVVRSADEITFSPSGDSITLSIQNQLLVFQVEETENPGEYVLKENIQSVMSSDIIITKVGERFFSEVLDDENRLVGVRMLFQAFDDDDLNKIAGTIISTQSINRNLILNK